MPVYCFILYIFAQQSNYRSKVIVYGKYIVLSMKMSMEQHPQMPLEPEMVEELAERQPTAFEESTSQLLTMLDEAPHQPHNPRYFNVTWDEREPGRATSLASLIVRPTGARKQELYGDFYQAQFEITHCTQDGSESYEFVWATTGAQRRGEKIVPNQEAFARDYGYQPLRIANVVKTLTDRVRTLDDCIFLLRSLKGRTGVSMANPYIANRVNTFTSDFTYRDFAHLDPSAEADDMTTNAGKLFDLLREAQSFGQDVPKSTQGFLVSRLLRAVADKRLQTDPDKLNSQQALEILEAALDQDVITSPNIKQRVLSFAPMYRYSSAVERMHEYLEDPKNNKGPKNIVGVARPTFAAGFIMARLREEVLPDEVIEQIEKVRLVTGVVDAAQQNHEILENILTRVAHALNIEEDDINVVNASGIAATFAYILEELHPEADEAQFAFDQKCVDIVEKALARSRTYSKVGKKALRGGDVTLLDDNERETW